MAALTGSVGPLKNTRLLPIEVPKLEPLMVIVAPAAAVDGERLVIVGAALVPATAKGTPLLTCPSTVTTIFPLVAPDGTGTTIAVGLQVLGMADRPLKVMVLVP